MGVNTPCEADKHGASGAIVVLGLLEKRFDVLADGVEVALLALGSRHCVCAETVGVKEGGNLLLVRRVLWRKTGEVSSTFTLVRLPSLCFFVPRLHASQLHRGSWRLPHMHGRPLELSADKSTFLAYRLASLRMRWVFSGFCDRDKKKLPRHCRQRRCREDRCCCHRELVSSVVREPHCRRRKDTARRKWRAAN